MRYLFFITLLSIFLAYLPLPPPPKLTGTEAFQLLEHAAEVVQLSDAAFQTDFFYIFRDSHCVFSYNPL